MHRNFPFLASAALAVAILIPAVAAAQAPPQSKAPVAPKAELLDPNACADISARGTVGQGGDIDEKKPPERNLSDRLARSGGVICPPAHVDSEIAQPPPGGGRMQVIPPPGGPGGDPKVQPR
jgi:hypothetical protein